MKYCEKCGTNISDDAKFCPNCGRENVAYQYAFEEKGNLYRRTNKRGATTTKPQPILGVVLMLVAILVVALIVGTVNSKNNVSGDKDEKTNINVIVEVEKYANLSSTELVALIGEPDEISQGNCTGKFEIPCIYYEYNSDDALGDVSFVLVNDSVVRFTSYGEYAYDGKENALAAFGLKMGGLCTLAADTDAALRYRCPSDKVDDFWITLIDGDKFGCLQITYDMEYYSEWYLPLSSSEEIKYKTSTELAVKSMLKSPSTADFPWYDWNYGKNLFYIYVSSYVDSENSFGAELRTEFTFVYSRTTEEVVLAIVNDEVIANNGYVKTEDLIKQLYEEKKNSKTEK